MIKKIDPSPAFQNSCKCDNVYRECLTRSHKCLSSLYYTYNIIFELHEMPDLVRRRSQPSEDKI